jgi:hypothetical protein
MRPDIIVRDQMGEPVLSVEVKARQSVDGRWAAQLRRNLRAHGQRVPAKFFMIVTSDNAYLWHENHGDQLDARPPDAEAPLSDLLGEDASSAEIIDGRTLELFVLSWLSAAAEAAELGELSESAQAFLIRSRLFEALRGAAVAFEPA